MRVASGVLNKNLTTGNTGKNKTVKVVESVPIFRYMRRFRRIFSSLLLLWRTTHNESDSQEGSCRRLRRSAVGLRWRRIWDCEPIDFADGRTISQIGDHLSSRTLAQPC